MRNIFETDVKTIEIFWTGGYDSSFRLLQLSQLPVRIQPFYLSDNRESEQMELSAIENIAEKIKTRKETKCELLPLKIVAKNQRISDKKITDAFYRLLRKEKIGSQYEWLAWFAKDHKGIELSIEKSMGSHIERLFEKLGAFSLISDELIGAYYVLDKNNSDEDVCTVFGNFHFPILETTKLDMKKLYLQWDCEDIMDLTWFCFTPVRGKPCGVCNPCKHAIIDGMRERFTKSALRRYKIRIPIKIIRKIIKITRNIINRARCRCSPHA